MVRGYPADNRGGCKERAALLLASKIPVQHEDCVAYAVTVA